ncbi:hypothetical protein [Dongshaea marina]|uniref:hypothetical protein n=1 Tax=Dongshaea marina TaxID=2047966 RepID=UPI000D3E88D9|nr:hypothetical protein [Dongshaea marina]
MLIFIVIVLIIILPLMMISSIITDSCKLLESLCRDPVPTLSSICAVGGTWLLWESDLSLGSFWAWLGVLILQLIVFLALFSWLAKLSQSKES